METLFILLPFIPLFALAGVYAERKVSAFMQDRMGPMHVGPAGLLQTAADILKLLLKEDISPASADPKLFRFGPILVITSIITGFALIPVSTNWLGANAATGVFLLLAIVSLDVIGILMAGWGSNSKFALLGAMRSVAQIISYELPLTLAVLAVCMWAGSLNLAEIGSLQGLGEGPVWFLGIAGLWDVAQVGGFFAWNIFQNPLLLVVFVIFFIATLAEANRAPFDLPEAESELVAGYHVEYSGFRWALLMLSEYGMMLLAALLGTLLFLGGWHSPLPNLGPLALADWTQGGGLLGNVLAIFWLLSKSFVLVFVQIWARWTLPRLRVDQLMALAWKYLTPISLVLLVIIGLWKVALTVSL